MTRKDPAYTAGQVAAAPPTVAQRAYDLLFSDYTQNGGTVVLTKTGTVLLAAVLIAGLVYVARRA